VTREIGELLRVAPFMLPPPSKEVLRANLRNQQPAPKGAGKRSLAGIVNASSLQVSRWFTKGYLVKLASLTRISYRLGIPVLDLSRCPPEVFSSGLVARAGRTCVARPVTRVSEFKAGDGHPGMF
jgi:hypothetical protein